MENNIIIKKILLIAFLGLYLTNNTGILIADDTLNTNGIVPDGISTKVDKDNNTYKISQGINLGLNRFYFFKYFNLQKGEIADFKDENINNTISFVNGGEYSFIDGTLTSFANNLIFINPSGVIFGKNANLKISGSFYVSTCNSIKFKDNISVPIDEDLNAENSILSSAPLSSFGFIDNDSKPLIALDGSKLNLSENNSFSIIAHDIKILNSSEDVNNTARIYAPGGQINLLAISDGKLNIENLHDFDYLNSNYNNMIWPAKTGDVHITDRAYLATKNMDSDKKSGNIFILGNNINFDDNSYINVKGNISGNVLIKSNGSVEFSNHSFILNYSTSNINFNSGTTTIDAKNIYFKSGAQINSYVDKEGQAGTINITASDSVIFEGEDSFINTASYHKGSKNSYAGNIYIYARFISFLDGGGIASHLNDGIKGGIININAYDTFVLKSLNKEDKSTITVSTLGTGQYSGDAGDISLNAKNIFILDGGGLESESYGMGSGGKIQIQAENLQINDNGFISTSSKDENLNVQGDAGDILMQAVNAEIINGGKIESITNGNGKGGEITIDCDRLLLDNNSNISSSSTSLNNGGDAGNINIKANISFKMKNNASITTQAYDAGGGQISVSSKDIFILSKSSLLTDVKYGLGNSGNILLNSYHLVIGNKSKLSATAYEGNGGNVHIITKSIIQSINSLIEVDSLYGKDGNIIIEKTIKNSSEDLTKIPDNYLDASEWIKTPCKNRFEKNISHLVYGPRDGHTKGFNDWLASPPLDFSLLINNDKIENKVNQNLSKAENYFYNGNYVESVEILEKIILSKDIPDIVYLNSIIYLANIYQETGHFNHALLLLKKAFDKYKFKMLFHDILNIYSGDTYLCINKIDRSLESLKEKNLKVINKNNHFSYIAFLNNKANLNASKTYYKRAINYYSRANDLIKMKKKLSKSFQVLKSRILINLLKANVHIYKEEKKHFEILKVYPEIITIIKHLKSIDDSYLKAGDWISLYFISEQIKNILDYEKFNFLNKQVNHKTLSKISEYCLINAFNIGKKLKSNYLLAHSTGYLGKLYENEKKLDISLLYTKKALFFSKTGHYPEILYELQWQLGRIYKKKGDIRLAKNYYYKAINTLKLIRNEFFQGYRHKSNFFYENIRPVFTELVKIYINDYKLENNNFINIDIKEAKQLIKIFEILKISNLQNYFKDECIIPENQEINDISNIPDNVGIIYPVILEDYLALFFIKKNEVKYCKIDQNAEKIEFIAKQYRELLESQNNALESKQNIELLNTQNDESETKQYKDLLEPQNEIIDISNNLYNWLIRPYEKELSKVETLIISPDASLYLVPFAALHDGNKYLIEKKAVLTIPCIYLTNFDQIIHKQDNNNLISGLTSNHNEFGLLPDVKNEIETIRDIIGGKILSGKDYTRDNLFKSFEQNNFSIVHIASHGVFGKTNEDTFLLTNNDKITMDDLKQLIDCNKARNHKVDLMVLSACQTALGDERASYGMAGTAIKTGVKSVIATLWSINDDIAVIIMKYFYKKYASSSLSKVQSFQFAQKQMIKQKYKICDWASFQLIGL